MYSSPPHFFASCFFSTPFFFLLVSGYFLVKLHTTLPQFSSCMHRVVISYVLGLYIFSGHRFFLFFYIHPTWFLHSISISYIQLLKSHNPIIQQVPPSYLFRTFYSPHLFIHPTHPPVCICKQTPLYVQTRKSLNGHPKTSYILFCLARTDESHSPKYLRNHSGTRSARTPAGDKLHSGDHAHV